MREKGRGGERERKRARVEKKQALTSYIGKLTIYAHLHTHTAYIRNEHFGILSYAEYSKILLSNVCLLESNILLSSFFFSGCFRFPSVPSLVYIK